MPLSEYDVLKTLGDPVLQRIDFSMDSMHVRGEAYQKIYDLIKDEQILVVEGKNPDKASYNADTDTIETQNTPSPPDLFNRSILVHECTHAIKDMERVTVTALGNEATAYLAQAVYLLLSDPQVQVPPGYGHVELAIKLARKFGLDTSPGNGIRVKYDDIIDLVRRLNSNAAYRQDKARLSVANGISPKPSYKLPIPPEPVTTDGQYSAMSAYKVPTDVLFEFNKHDIKPPAEPALQEAATYIKEFMGPGSRVWITGHTDNVGGSTYNKGLSKRRADAVAKWLIENKHVDATRVVTDGEGESKPIAPNTNPAGRAKNRRVEILIM
jgi:outer membrane protein OmpA-like peptidoglycan-associated protein